MSNGGFLSRWARLKEEAKKAPEAPPPEAAAPPPEPAPAEDDPDALQRLIDSLPKLEELTKDTDVRLFFQKGVPDVLRNAALKKVWALDPEVNRFSEMAEYAWDWNAPGGAPSFGPLEEGFDVSGMLERILPNRADYDFDPDRREPDHPDGCGRESQVAEEGATPPEADLAAPQHEAPADGADATADVAMTAPPARDEASAAPPADAATQNEAEAPLPVAPARPRRHGRALPG